MMPILITNGEKDEKDREISLFTPRNFNEAFYGKNALSQNEIYTRNKLFRTLILDMKEAEEWGEETDSNKNVILSHILQSDTDDNYSFLANTLKRNRGNFIYKNTRVIEYIIDFFTHNESEQFFLYLYRIDELWNTKSSTSSIMQKNLQCFFNDNNGCSVCDRCISFLSGKTDEADDAMLYMKCINALYIAGKESYAYALIVLWTLLNIHTIFLLPSIARIILYNDEPTTLFEKNRKYIIKSALNNNLYLSVLKTCEPLSANEGTNTQRELLFSVNSGQFHRKTSVFHFEKCSELDKRSPNDVPIESDSAESIINEREARKLLNKIQKYLRKDIPNLAKNLIPHKTEPYYITVTNKYLTCMGWFSQTRIMLQTRREKTSRWSFTDSPSIVGIFNAGIFLNIFAIDIPNGGQLSRTLLWCFPALSQSAQKFTVHEVIEWGEDVKYEIFQRHECSEI